MLSDAPACDMLDIEDYLALPVHRLFAFFNSLNVRSSLHVMRTKAISETCAVDMGKRRKAASASRVRSL